VSYFDVKYKTTADQEGSKMTQILMDRPEIIQSRFIINFKPEIFIPEIKQKIYEKYFCCTLL